MCFDIERGLVPEIWIAFAEVTGIPEHKRTARDEPDYDKLMRFRIGILKENGGFLFRSTEQIMKDYPQYPAFEEYDELLKAIKEQL